MSTMLKITALIMITLFTSCKIDRDKAVDRAKFNFKTGDDTELFFKNMRQSYYDMEENKAAKFNVFRHEDRIKETDRPLLNLAIVLNYLQDEAYLLIEPNDVLRDEDTITIKWKSVQSDDGIITLKGYNREAMLEFSSQVYEALQKQAEFEVELGESYAPILTSAEERESFRITVADFYRLTRVY